MIWLPTDWRLSGVAGIVAFITALSGLEGLVRDQGFAKPEEIAATALFLASDQARQITGTDLVVDAGFSLS